MKTYSERKIALLFCGELNVQFGSVAKNVAKTCKQLFFVALKKSSKLVKFAVLLIIITSQFKGTFTSGTHLNIFRKFRFHFQAETDFERKKKHLNPHRSGLIFA